MTDFTIDDYLNNGQNLIHEFIYGPAKVKKTWWSGTAAQAGYNVTFLYSDKRGGLKILKQIPEEDRKRIRIIDIKDRLNYPVTSLFMTKFLRNNPFIYCIDNGSFIGIPSQMKDEHHHVYIDPRKLNSNDVLVIDSYDGIVDSIEFQYAAENGIKLEEAAKQQWEGYRWCGAMATFILNGLDKLPCHVIVIGHEQDYEKRKQWINPKTGQMETIIVDIRKQPKSTSGPHAQTISQDFQDMLIFRVEGEAIKIDSRPMQGRDTGSCEIPPSSYNWKDMLFPRVAQMVGIKPDPELAYEAFKFLKPGEKPDMVVEEVKSQQPSAQVAASSGSMKMNPFGKK